MQHTQQFGKHASARPIRIATHLPTVTGPSVLSNPSSAIPGSGSAQWSLRPPFQPAFRSIPCHSLIETSSGPSDAATTLPQQEPDVNNPALQAAAQELAQSLPLSEAFTEEERQQIILRAFGWSKQV